MAIKIIKPGRKKIPIYGAKCGYCDCEFEFNKEDFKIQYDRDGEFGQIDCPHCANTVTFSNRPKRYSIVK